MDLISSDSHYIKPHSIAGLKIEITTRHPEVPHLTKDSNCDFKVYSFRSQDDTRAEVLSSTDEDCLQDASTKKEVGNKITGKKILIISKDRKAISKPKKIAHSGRHNSNLITTSEYTYCELHEEYHHILNSNDYLIQHEEKKKIIQEELNQLGT